MLKGIEGDKGLVVKNAAAHHAISAKFPKKIDNKGKTLVVQYEVKLQSKSRVINHAGYVSDVVFHRRPGLRWGLHEAPPGQQEASR